MKFDPDAYLAGATGEFDPDAYLTDAQAPFANGPLKIGADAFPDQLRQELKDAGGAIRNIAGAGTALSNLWEGTKQFVGQHDPQRIEANKIIRNEAPIGAITGDIATTAIPFGMAGNSVKAVAALGAGYGALQPVSGEQSFANIAKGKFINTGLGAATAAGGQAAANKLLSGVSNKLASIEQKVQAKAAQIAASDTASARSAAGNAAQNAYRQLEHIRELGSYRALTPEEALLAHQLEQELAGKAVDKLMPAAALKEATSQAYKDAMATEQARAAQYAAEKLSSNEMKQQIMARMKRYGPAAAGGLIGNALFPGLGAVGGAATGLVLRPALRSMVNLSKNPAIQHGMLSPMKNSRVLTQPYLPISALLAGDALMGQ